MCGLTKPVSSFYVDYNKRGGKRKPYRRSICNTCIGRRRKIGYTKTPEAFIKRLFTQLRSKRLKQRIPVTIDYNYILNLYYKQDGRCALSGVKLTHLSSNILKMFDRNPNNISIDRKDTTKGYISGNIQLVCKRVNIMKHSLTDKQFKVWIKKISKHSL